MHRVAAPSATLGRGSFCYSFSCAPTIWWGIQPWGLCRESPDPLPSLCDGEGSSSPGLVPSDDTVNSDSVLVVKPGDSSVVIGYQGDEFTCTWSAEQFVACSHIYPWFTGKVASLTHVPLEPGCEDYAFWIRLLLTLNKDWTPSSLIYLRHWNWTLPWRSLMLLHLLQSLLGFSAWLVPFLIILSCSLLLAFVLITVVPGYCSSCPCVSGYKDVSILNWSVTFLSHPAAFGFWASTPPDNISLNSAIRKAVQSLSDYQTGIGATAHATLDTEQLISHLQVALVDTLSSLPQAEGDVIPVSEVCELLLQIHGILDKALSKWAGNSAHILAHLLNSVSRQRCENAFSIDLQDACLHVPIVKHHHCFLGFVWHNVPYQWKVLPFGLATPLGFLHPSRNLFCSFAIAKVCILLSIWMTSWSSFTLTGWVRGHAFLCSSLVCLGLHINFSKSDLCLSQSLLSWGYVGILSACWYLYLLIS